MRGGWVRKHALMHASMHPRTHARTHARSHTRKVSKVADLAMALSHVAHSHIAFLTAAPPPHHTRTHPGTPLLTPPTGWPNNFESTQVIGQRQADKAQELWGSALASGEGFDYAL